MELETLKQLLKDGIITQEQYNQLAPGLEKPKPPKTEAKPEKEPTEETDKPAPKDPPEDPLPGNLEQLIQKAVDRATNKLGNDNKKLREDLERERKKNLSAEELKVLELQEKEQEIADRETAIREKENRLYAIKALKKAKLDDGDEDSLELVEFVLGADEAAIDLRVKALQKFSQRVAKRTTEDIYRSNGRTPEKGTPKGAEPNPYRPDTLNLTKQMEMELHDPEAAKRLKAEAGVI